MASIASRRSVPLSWRLRAWWEDFEPTERQRQAAGIALLVAIGGFWGALVGMLGTPAALICLSLAGCVLCVKDFRFGVGILVAIMPISQSAVFPHAMFGITGLNPLNLLLVTTLGSLMMRALGDTTWKNFLPRRVFWLYILPLGVGAALGTFHVDEIPKIFHDFELIFFTNAAGYVRDMFGKPMTFVLFALLVAAAVQRSERPERFITPMVISVFVMALVAVIFVVMKGMSFAQLSGTFNRHMLSDLGMHANDLGRLYATAFAILLFVWDRTTLATFKFGLVIAMFVVFVALVLTFSRGAFLCLILVGIVYLASRRNMRTMLMASVLLPVAVALAPGAIWTRLTMGFGAGANAVSAGRTDEIWAPLLPELFASPIWGQGLSSILWSRAMIEGRLPAVGHPHNAYLQALTDVGVLGLILLLGFWIMCWRDMRRFARDERLKPELQGFFEGAAAGILAFLVAGMAGSSLAPKPEQAFMWLAVGMLFGVRQRLVRLGAN